MIFGFLLGGGGRKFNPLLVEFFRKEIFETILAEAKTQRKTDPTKTRFSVLLNIHRQGGELEPSGEEKIGLILEPSEVERVGVNNIFSVQFEVDLVKRKIFLSPRAKQGFETILQIPEISSEERSVILAILKFQNKKAVTKQEAQRMLTEPPPPPPPPEENTLSQVRRLKRTGTLPLFGGIPEGASPDYPELVGAIREDLTRLAPEVWEQTPFVDNPPLLRYINPPILIGRLVLDGMGELLGYSLGRLPFSGDGKIITHQSYTGKGSEINVLLVKDGTLLRYQPKSGLNEFQRMTLNGVMQLLENLAARQGFFQEYPYYMEMIHDTGLGKLLFNFNQALATGLQANHNYAAKLLLMRAGDSFSWVPTEKSGSAVPPNTIAVVEVELTPLRRGGNQVVHDFAYHVVKGNLPKAVGEVLKFIQWRVSQGKLGG